MIGVNLKDMVGFNPLQYDSNPITVLVRVLVDC